MLSSALDSKVLQQQRFLGALILVGAVFRVWLNLSDLRKVASPL